MTRVRRGAPALMCWWDSCFGARAEETKREETLLKRQMHQSEHFGFLIWSDPENLASGEILVVHLKIRLTGQLLA